MSLQDEIRDAFPDLVDEIRVKKESDLNGQRATEVCVVLGTGQTITGTFVTEARPGFGGIEFSSVKDIAALMTTKIRAVLNGKADIS